MNARTLALVIAGGLFYQIAPGLFWLAALVGIFLAVRALRAKSEEVGGIRNALGEFAAPVTDSVKKELSAKRRVKSKPNAQAPKTQVPEPVLVDEHDYSKVEVEDDILEGLDEEVLFVPKGFDTKRSKGGCKEHGLDHNCPLER